MALIELLHSMDQMLAFQKYTIHKKEAFKFTNNASSLAHPTFLQASIGMGGKGQGQVVLPNGLNKFWLNEATDADDDGTRSSQGDRSTQHDLPHQTASTVADHGPSSRLTQQKRMTSKYNLRQSPRRPKKFSN